MPEVISRTQKGNTVIVWFYTYDEEERLSDLDALPTCEVWKDNVQVIEPKGMWRHGIGVYRYDLATEAFSPGTYRIVCRGVLQGLRIVQDTPLEVTRPWLLNE